MIRRSKGYAVVEVMNIDREIRSSFSRLIDSLAFHNGDRIDIEKAKAQFKIIVDRTIRDFEKDMATFPQEDDSNRIVERIMRT